MQLDIRDQFCDWPEEPGQTFREVYGVDDFVADEYGRYRVETVGEVNNYLAIQAAAEGSRLSEMLSQFLKTGDDSFLNVKKGVYIDTTGIPRSLEDLKRVMDNAESGISQLFEKTHGLFKDKKELEAALLDGSFNDKYAAFVSKADEKKEGEKSE